MTSEQLSLGAHQLQRLMRGLWTFFTGVFFVYTIKRLLQGLLTLFLASMLSFAIIQLAPGDPIDPFLLDPNISPERIADLKAQFGLDRPVMEQYWYWLWQIVRHGNFGISVVSQRPVISLILERMGNTLLLAIASIVITWAIAIPLGIIGAVNQNQWSDRILRVFSYMGQGFPSFVAALLLLFLAQSTPLFPVGDMTSVDHADLSALGKILDIAWHMILPTLGLSLIGFAGLQRITRGNMLDVLRQNYIQTARAKGLPEERVIYMHALRNAVNPLITILGFEFASLLSGSFIAEFFFNWPGLGRLILKAVQDTDLYLVMAGLMMGATMLIIGNLLADLLLKVVDPRIQLGEMQ